jgi:uncharacterized protein (TIGR00299 family) protein
MTLGALIDAGVDAAPVTDGIASLELPVRVEVEKVRKGGFAATRVHVESADEPAHRFLPDVEKIIERGGLTSRQRDLAMRIFRRLAEAEAAAHGMPLEKVHFHEVGAVDSIADIVGCAIGLDLLDVERFTSGPVATGSGTVECAHGLMPIPAPGTAQLLKGVPVSGSAIKAELTTPTGAAILTTVVQDWIDSPSMTIEKIGHGAGKRNLPQQPNVLRLFVGTSADDQGSQQDRVWMLETNLDDVPPEMIGYCYDVLLSAGALDVFTIPIFMKKNRPGVLLSVLAPEANLPTLEEILFRETATFGIRRYAVSRHKLSRRPHVVQTPWGPVRGKLGWRGNRSAVFAPEYEDCARVARAHGVALREVFAAVQQAFGDEIPAGLRDENNAECE